jgi:hypothetical protein
MLLFLVAYATYPMVMISGQEESRWSTSENPDFGISLQYPSNWNISKFNTSLLDTTHTILSIDTNNTHFGISAEELFSNTTVKEHAREVYNQLKQDDGFQRINDESIAIDGVPAWNLEYQMTLPDFIGKATNIWFIKDNRVFEIAYTTDDPDAQTNNFPIFQRMMKTFHINSNK